MTYPANMPEKGLKEKVLIRKEMSPAKVRARCNLFGSPAPGETSKMLQTVLKGKKMEFDRKYKIIGEVLRVPRSSENCAPNSHISPIFTKATKEDVICNKS